MATVSRSKIVLRAALTIVAGLAAGLVIGCGGDRELSAEELVAEFNAKALSNARLELGDQLFTTDAAAGEVFALSLNVPGNFGSTGAGSLVVLDSSEEGLVEFNRCESSVNLVCYRAANIVLRFEELDLNGQAAVARTLQAVSDAASTR